MKQIPPNIRNKWVLDQHNTFGVPAGYADTFVQKAFGKLVLLVILFIYVGNPCTRRGSYWSNEPFVGFAVLSSNAVF